MGVETKGFIFQRVSPSKTAISGLFWTAVSSYYSSINDYFLSLQNGATIYYECGDGTCYCKLIALNPPKDKHKNSEEKPLNYQRKCWAEGNQSALLNTADQTEKLIYYPKKGEVFKQVNNEKQLILKCPISPKTSWKYTLPGDTTESRYKNEVSCKYSEIGLYEKFKRTCFTTRCHGEKNYETKYCYGLGPILQIEGGIVTTPVQNNFF